MIVTRLWLMIVFVITVHVIDTSTIRFIISIVFGVFIALEFIFICSLVHLRSTGRCEWMALVTA